MEFDTNEYKKKIKSIEMYHQWPLISHLPIIPISPLVLLHLEPLGLPRLTAVCSPSLGLVPLHTGS
jgi:hypothetical protein